MRTWLLSLLVLAAPAYAEAPANVVVAPAGDCAGDERNLAPRTLPEAPPSEPAPLEVGILHLTPGNVAASSPLAGMPLPVPAAFAGPGACDTPGSGCAGEKSFEDPNPGTGCGFPGSVCP